MSAAEALAEHYAKTQPLLITEGITHKQLASILRDASIEAEARVLKLAGGSPSDVVGRLQARQIAAGLRDVTDQVWKGTGRITQAGIYQQAWLANDQMMDLALFNGMSGMASIQMAQALHFEAAQVVEDIISRRTEGFALSERIYANGKVTTKQVGKLIEQGIAQQLSARDLAKSVKQFYRPDVPGGASYAAQRLARTEINNAHHTTTIRLSKDKPWIQGFKWNLSGSHKVPDECNEYAERESGLGPGVFDKGDTPAKPHPQCSIAGTMVNGPLLEGVMSRWFEGDVIEINTLHGNSLTVTPNHPILTLEGWIPAGKLHTGQYVICDGSDVERNGAIQSGSFSIPYNQYTPTRVENISASLWPTGSGSFTTMPVSSEDFHGDGFDSDVNIVWTDSFLQSWIETYVDEFLCEIESFCRDMMLSLLVGNGSLTHGLESLRYSSNGFMSGLGSGSSSFNPIATQEIQYGRTGDADFFSERVRRLSGQVTTDQIIVIRNYYFAGHVYNLQTSDGYYVSNGIVSHNCLCYLTHVMDSDEEFANNLVNGKYDDYLDSKGVTC